MRCYILGNRVFTYGTLMTGESNHYVIQPFLVAVEPAILSGMVMLLAAPHYPGIVPGDGTVSGQLMTVARPAEAIQALDDLELYFGPGHPENEYERESLKVQLLDGSSVEAWVYLFLRSTLIMPTIVGGDWRSRP
jgi:gamma-glutamylcyclotransferase (GGCT)/AIG2-like uncharacterized protein YtfP